MDYKENVMKKQYVLVMLGSILLCTSVGCAMTRNAEKERVVDVHTVANESETVLGVVRTRAEKTLEQSDTISAQDDAGTDDMRQRQSDGTTKAEHGAITFASAISFEPADEMSYVHASTLNIRLDASTQAVVESVLKKGEKIHVIGKSKDWYRVEINGKTLYAAAAYISSKMPETTSATTTSVSGSIGLNSDWKYASFSKINSGTATLYKASSNRKDITIAVNAGHGTKGGGNVKTYSHPDKTPKVTGGTNASGAVQSTAISSGMTFLDGTSEAAVTLKMAKVLKDELLKRGYDVVMIRESEDVQLDNIARTVIANNTASAHIAVHWDSTTNDKGAYYMKVPNVASYKAMEPVASTWKKSDAFGEALIGGLRSNGVKIFSGGSMEMDLTQTSYSTIPSIAIELGDRASDYSTTTLQVHAKGLADGVSAYFGR